MPGDQDKNLTLRNLAEAWPLCNIKECRIELQIPDNTIVEMHLWWYFTGKPATLIVQCENEVHKITMTNRCKNIINKLCNTGYMMYLTGAYRSQ